MDIIHFKSFNITGVSKLADVANSVPGRFPTDQEPDVLLQLAFIPRIVRRAFERP